MPTGSQQNASSKIHEYVPPKNWDDLTADEKIERLREIIKSMNGSISRLQSDNHYLRQNFKDHSHSEKGIVVPFKEYAGYAIGTDAVSLSNDKFF